MVNFRLASYYQTPIYFCLFKTPACASQPIMEICSFTAPGIKNLQYFAAQPLFTAVIINEDAKNRSVTTFLRPGEKSLVN